MCKHLSVSVFTPFGYIPRSGTGESYGNSMFNFLRNRQTFPKQLHHLISPPAVYKGSTFSASLLEVTCVQGWAVVGLPFRRPRASGLSAGLAGVWASHQDLSEP